jgi:hypothetical protein
MYWGQEVGICVSKMLANQTGLANVDDLRFLGMRVEEMSAI